MTATASPDLLKMFAKATASPLVYCDYIAERIRENLAESDPARIITRVGPIKWDLHPEGGYYLSPTKTLEVTDRNGKRYRITVEEIGQ